MGDDQAGSDIDVAHPIRHQALGPPHLVEGVAPLDPQTRPDGRSSGFGDGDLLAVLESSAVESFDDLDFGVVTMDRAGVVVGYNADEARRSGLSRERVLGRDFFVEVGPCTNNYLVADRYRKTAELDGALDEELDYVFTFRMRPTPVRLRLLAAQGSPRQYLVVRSR